MVKKYESGVRAMDHIGRLTGRSTKINGHISEIFAKNENTIVICEIETIDSIDDSC